MPKFYCDYCDIFLTHDSPSVRKAHGKGWKHIMQVERYYSALSPEKCQEILDVISKSYTGNGEARDDDRWSSSYSSPHGARPPMYSPTSPGFRPPPPGRSPYGGPPPHSRSYDDNNHRHAPYRSYGGGGPPSNHYHSSGGYQRRPPRGRDYSRRGGGYDPHGRSRSPSRGRFSRPGFRGGYNSHRPPPPYHDHGPHDYRSGGGHPPPPPPPYNSDSRRSPGYSGPGSSYPA
ncbi:U1 small nuclear ribonucleoprotein C [Dimargaris verticillata]|uniref:U1 small nuclear ribonucleoprotein C n=1 Tax=Dimargaris verticillata TaxID=2761393 RepID=A0A9W8B2Q1_9FUNG|nr:U1 small nuclear ribonucleoprotein C [Dimargaris verticillata]